MKSKISQVKVPLEVVIGETSHTIEEISRIGVGSIIELDTLAGEPVSLRASGVEIARAEVVVIDESFGVRVTELVEQTAGPAEG